METPDTRDWSFSKRALYQNKKKQKRPTHRHYRNRRSYWVQVQFTNGKIENYQLAKDLQQPLDEHRQHHPGEWRDILLGALINVPISQYHNGEAKIKPGIIIRIFILPVHTSNPRWITRSQFIKPDYSWMKWFFNRVQLSRELSFLTHDFQPQNQQRIRAILAQYRLQKVKQVRQRIWRCVLFIGIGLALILGISSLVVL
ncbi:hypothetical protein H5S09_05165 [Limosilactobacillus sp. STM2_1]|uniref:Uncharacterized protein n=1 Tax=Limosilactobacillus rudii TaxID=2759755 RepID=A0A7W3UKM9_9LACO|nr:hypothetical protein [Limosilactobacillus rudii]MBB1079235.1 hypothetical protein [Limosilactobacillus rudii]MBB1097324.1 hypothetical protein [Limosilactobacillus rudii]MCD7134433.1 hypothetical protein [Limosilactobacillus rudii]